MKRVFADAAYWIAVINPLDNLHTKAKEASKRLGQVRIYTSEMVLTEVLNSLGGKGLTIRQKTVKMVESIINSANVEVMPQTSTLYRSALEFYKSRPDKDWGLTDCSSFIIMKEKSLVEALTSDHHFQQAGYQTLLAND